MMRLQKGQNGRMTDRRMIQAAAWRDEQEAGYTRFGFWLRRRRKLLDLTQAELAAKVYCSEEMIRKIEADQRQPGRQLAERLADVLQINSELRAAFLAAARSGEMGATPDRLPAASADLTSPRPPTAEEAAVGQYRIRADQRVYLPRPLSPLIGRDVETAYLLNLLKAGESRVVTLTGPGGVGKTRLALRVAELGSRLYPDGVFFVNLAPLQSHTRLMNAIAQALGIRDTAELTIDDHVLDVLRDLRALLLLDNFEHMIAAAPRLVTLLQQCPLVAALVTSRVLLSISGERRFDVQPLPCPTPEDLEGSGESLLVAVKRSDAVRLFIERAQAVYPTFQLTDTTARIVAWLCEHLDGLPLAIELAATQSVSFSPETLLRGLTDRFALLVGGPADLPMRQQTLRATIAWSYDMLATDQQQLFRWLSAFAGGFTLESAEQLVTRLETQAAQLGGSALTKRPVRRLLDTLVRSSMIVRIDHEAETRYTMLETLREYGREQLIDSGELDDVYQAHAEGMLVLAERAAPELHGRDQRVWLDRLEPEQDNCWVALSWFLEHNLVDEGIRLVVALKPFWMARGYLGQGYAWADRYLVAAGNKSLLRAQLLLVAGKLALLQGNFDTARQQLEEALALSRAVDYRAVAACALAQLADLERASGQLSTALSLADQSITLYQTLDDKHGLAEALQIKGAVVRNQGNYAEARALVDTSLELYRAIGDQLGIAFSLYRLGILAFYSGDLGRERACYEQSLAIQSALGDKGGMAGTLNNLGMVLVVLGEFDDAQSRYEQSLEIYRLIGDRIGQANALINLGDLGRVRSDFVQSAVCFTDALDLFRAANNQRGVALALVGLGHVTLHNGNVAQAAEYFKASAAHFAALDNSRGLALSLAGYAKIACFLGVYEDAAAWLGSVDASLRSSARPFDPVDARIFQETVQQVRTQAGPEAFERAWQVGQALKLNIAVKQAPDQIDIYLRR